MIDCNYYAKGFINGEKKVIHCPTVEDAMRANSKEWDIFWCPNIKNSTGSRKKADVKEIEWIFADFDNIKLDKLKRSLNGVLDPSLVIKTRGGFHVYWRIEPIEYDDKVDQAFKDFCDTRLIPLGADNQVKDVTRLLRPPMMRYWYDSKDKKYMNDEIHTELVYETKNVYQWDQLFELFPKQRKMLNTEKRLEVRPVNDDGADIWVLAKLIPIKQALMDLSGKGCVGYEQYSFKKDGAGDRIIINGQPSNAWIDKDGKIGSTVDAGPTIVQWIRYYGHDWPKVAEIIKENLLIQ